MKNIERTLKKSLVFIFVIGVCASVCSCSKDKILDSDLTKYQWELKSVKINSNLYNVPSGNFQLSEAYMLSFESDSILHIPTNVNTAYVKYRILKEGEIVIYGVSQTLVGEGKYTDFNNALRLAIENTSNFSIEGKSLVFKGNNTEMRFKKK